MQPGQFQIESPTAARPANAVAWGATISEANASVLTLLAGVALRGHLCDGERDLLDRFAAPNTLVFLVENNTYLHPENVEIVPFDQIQATLHAGDDAVFSHRQHLSDDLGRKTRTIRTARIGQTARGPLVLGMIGAELPELRTEHDRHFSAIAQNFRAAFKGLLPLTDWLTSRLARPEPTVIVGRSTGRVLALNQNAQTLLAPNGNAAIGEEFSSIRSSLVRPVGRERLSMENRSHGGLDVTVISVTAASARGKIAGPQIGAGFLEGMRHKTAGIMAAARFLQTALDQQPGHPVTEMLRIILDESAELDHDLCRHQLLAEYPRFAAETIDPVACLRKAIEARIMGRTCHDVALNEHLTAPVRIDIPRKALMFLYESILCTHCGAGSNAKTTIMVRHRDSGGIVLSFVTDCGRPRSESVYHEWRDYCDRLADAMNVPMEHRTTADYSQTETTLTLMA
ncbi:hypothetical protein C3F09_02660 [candidate division GN15 bacterium]|uniref:Uncharacterized protein n=1 Tax=candidate division GN15 bacterium TaxID=2072418 RepID=A0A855XAU3_9BACT|nr:MAG: hypothetical protein C3F09_02660 [candidate division GN15 bacterium]